MREFGRAAQSARKLGEPGRAVGPFCRQMVALLPEKALHGLVGQHRAQHALAVHINEILVGACAAFQHPDPQALGLELLVPVFHPAGKVGAVPGLVAEQARRFQAGQHRRALLDHHGLKIALHRLFPPLRAFLPVWPETGGFMS